MIPALGRIASVGALVVALAGCTSAGPRAAPFCTNPHDSVFVLIAQSVPQATQLPCVAELPAGWAYGGSQVASSVSKLWLDSDRAGIHAVEVALVPACDVAGAVKEQPAPDEVATTVYVRPETLEPAFTGERFLVFPGGCIRFRFDFAAGASSALAIEAIEAVSLIPRSAVVAAVSADPGLTLCGAEAPPCAS